MTDAKSDRDAAGSFALGRSQVNRIGDGAMQLAGDNVFGPPRDRDEAVHMLRAAIDSGINHIDTAQYYGPGTVNEVIREALYPYPSDLAIVSKVAARRDDAGAVLPYDEPDQLRTGIEENLSTLGLDRLAAVNLRVMDGSRPGHRFDAQLAALVKARDEGLVDGTGLSNISREHLRRAIGQSRWRGCSTSHPTFYSSPAPGPASIWPRTSDRPAFESTTRPARSWHGTSPSSQLGNCRSCLGVLVHRAIGHSELVMSNR